MLVIGTLDIGGTEKQLVELACGLDQRRFVPMVVCLSAGGPLKDHLDRHGVPVQILGFRGSRLDPVCFVRELYRFVELIRASAPDVIHLFLYWSCVVGGLAARLAGHRCVISARRSLGRFKEGQPHLLLAERVVNRWVSCFTANSSAVMEDACRREHLPTNRMKAIYNGVGIISEKSELSKSESIVPCEFRGASFVVVILANLIAYKGHLWFLEAWQRVHARLPQAKAILIGEGPMRPVIEERIRELSLQHSIVLAGLCEKPHEWLERADLLVHPSSEEGCSNAILEAMARGLPVVAADVGGNRELIESGRDGLLVRYGDTTTLARTILDLASDLGRRQGLGAAARKRVEQNFTLGRMIREHEDLYTQQCRRKNRVLRESNAPAIFLSAVSDIVRDSMVS